MELWIRSQDKYKIVNAYRIYIKTIEEETGMVKRYRYLINDDSADMTLGKYKSEERAKEVLDDIYSRIKENNKSDNCFYEMPKE